MRRIVMLMFLMLLVGCGDAVVPTEPAEAPTTASVAPTEPAEEPTAISEAPTAPAEEPTAISEVPTEPAEAPTAPAEQPTEEIIPTQAALTLPASLYLLSEESGSRQIWRVEADGQTVTQISNEEVAIENYDVSPATGELVYVVGNQVVKLSPDGQQRSVIFEGASLDENYYNDPHTPRWSPDGQEIMLAYGGLAVMPANGGEPEILIPNIPQSNPELVDVFPVETIYVPESWSPDGERMLISEGYVPEGATVMVVNRNNIDDRVEIRPEQGFLCCNMRWSPDGESIVFSNDMFGMVVPGLWRANTFTGEITAYSEGTYDTGPWLKASGAFPIGDGTIRAFTQYSEEAPMPGGDPVRLQMSEVAADGSVTPLREDSFPVLEALWFPDGAAAVVLDQYSGVEPFIVAPGDAPVTLLPITGNRMRWGR